MKVEEIKAEGALYFENIVDGCRHYQHEMIEMNAKQAENRFMEMWKKQECKNAYVDFYYFTLEEEAKEKVSGVLTAEELEYLKVLEKERVESGEDSKDIIFPFNEQLIKIVVKLNESGMLFSTFYFTGTDRSTWWGNYNMEYWVFYEAEE